MTKKLKTTDSEQNSDLKSDSCIVFTMIPTEQDVCPAEQGTCNRTSEEKQRAWAGASDVKQETCEEERHTCDETPEMENGKGDKEQV